MLVPPIPFTNPGESTEMDFPYLSNDDFDDPTSVGTISFPLTGFVNGNFVCIKLSFLIVCFKNYQATYLLVVC